MSNKKVNFAVDIASTYIYWVLFIFVFIVSIYLRLYNFTQGIYQNDSIQYWITAKKWLDGQIVFTDGPLHIEFFRPSLYYFHSLAFKVFGINDYAIKLFTGLSDVMTLMFLYFVGRLIFTNAWISLAPLLLYGFLPKVIYYSRMEIAHIPSGMFVALSFLFYVLYERQYKQHKFGSLILLTACGVSVSIAATMHEDLGAIWAGYCFVLLADLVFQRINKVTVTKYLLSTFSLTAGFLSLFVAFGYFIGYGRIFSMMAGESGFIVDSTRFPLSYSLGLLTHAFANIATIPLQILFYISLAIAMYSFLVRREKKYKTYTYAPFLIFITYIVILDIVMDRVNYLQHARLLLPLLPFCAIAIVYWFYHILSKFSGRFAVIAVLLMSIFVPAFGISSDYEMLKRNIFHVKKHKAIFNYMKDHVDKEHRLLIAPTSLFPGQRVFSLEMYFDGNAIYTVDFNDKGKTLQEYVDQLKIKYVYLPKKQEIDKTSSYYHMIANLPLGEEASNVRLPYMRCSFSDPLNCWTEDFNPGAYIGLDKTEYTPQAEINYLLDYIKEKGRGIIFEDNSIMIVELI